MKRFVAAAVAGLLALSLVACGSSGKSHIEQIKSKGVLVLGTSADYPPYEFHQTAGGKDQIVGWEMDMAQEIAKDLGVKLEIKESAFDGLIADLQTKKVDMVISAMTITEKRQKSVDFSDPYWQGGQVMLALKDQAGQYKSAADFKGKTVGVQLGSTGEEEAKKIEGANVKPVDKFESTVLDLLSGKVDLVVAGYTVGKNYEQKNPKLKVVQQLNSELNAVALRKGDKELADAVNASLKQMKADGRLDKFVKQYQAEESK